MQVRHDRIRVGLFDTQARQIIGTTRDDKVQETLLGAYGQTSVELTPWLRGIVGVRADQVVDSTRKWLDLIHPADRELFRGTALAAREHGTRVQVEYRLWHRGGRWVHVRQVMEPIPGKRDAQGRRRWFNTLQDITIQKVAEEKISRLNRLYAVLNGINSSR